MKIVIYVTLVTTYCKFRKVVALFLSVWTLPRAQTADSLRGKLSCLFILKTIVNSFIFVEQSI